MKAYNTKGKPHHQLVEVKRLIEEGKWHVSRRNGTEKARKMGFSRPHEAIREAVLELSPSDFIKSTTSYHDHKLWHDYYISVYEGHKVIMHLGIVDNGDDGKTVIFSFHDAD